MPTIYLDACCLNRPFDDQSQPRVHLESEAILILLARVKTNEWEWLSSTVLDLEINQITDPARKNRIKLLMTAVHRVVLVQTIEAQRGKELSAMDIPAIDALHIACAESGGADVLLTTDDRLLRQTARLAKQLRVRVENPLTWVKEQSEK
ncbi:MAG: PIN domain-containing protein [Chloroflexi bacterium]|nr:PIN domain-containing protein [Chloroflexota bacterium]